MHPKSWRILASNDKSQWAQIDIRENDSHLNGPYYVHHYICRRYNYDRYNPNGYKYVRFVQDKNWANNQNQGYFNIQYFELYGTIL